MKILNESLIEENTIMERYYTNERNSQILIALLKAHNIQNIIISPGATNVNFVGSIQYDNFFKIYSCVDERSACYMACGLAEETGNPVALSCTGATASRNYIPGLTEAFYRNLPILAITSSQHIGHIGQMFPQMLDRRNLLNDITNLSVDIPTIHDSEDEWSVNTLLNTALLELTHHNGGPVHINLVTQYNNDFTTKALPKTRVIKRFCNQSMIPELPQDGIAIFVGAHSKWSKELTLTVNQFCENNNAVVICDHTSNYKGNNKVLANLVCNQRQFESKLKSINLLLHIGEISGAYLSLTPKEVWRISPDGKIRDPFKKLTNVFEMDEISFFKAYSKKTNIHNRTIDYYQEWKKIRKEILDKLPELPFSNIWVAQNTAPKLPKNSVLHLAILNSLRSWNFFDIDDSIYCYSNTGGFGIDGCASTFIGASLANKDKLYFCVIGDLAFFYDINAIFNRNVGKNLRIMLINNGKGTEFRNYAHPANAFGNDADLYMAAANHNGKKSVNLVKHIAEDLGFEYLSASNKDEFKKVIDKFTTFKTNEKSIIFEIFTNSEEESTALYTVEHTMISTEKKVKDATKGLIKNIIGNNGINTLKRIIGK